MPKKYNPGDKLGKLNILFIEELPKLDKKNRRGVFQCPYCNNTFIANLNNVVYNRTKSCGCFRSNNTRKHIIQTTDAIPMMSFIHDDRIVFRLNILFIEMVNWKRKKNEI